MQKYFWVWKIKTLRIINIWGYTLLQSSSLTCSIKNIWLQVTSVSFPYIHHYTETLWLSYMQHNMYSMIYNMMYILCVHVYICVCELIWIPELLICFYLAFYHFIFLHVSWYVLSEHFHFSFPIIYLANLLYFFLYMHLKDNLSSCIKMSWNFY